MASQEDCKYCAQSTRHKTKVKATPMMQKDEVLEAARRAKMAGSTRFCMGTAWRELGAKKTAFKRIVGMVREIKKPNPDPDPDPNPHPHPNQVSDIKKLDLSPHLPTSPHISPHLRTSPHISR